MATWYPYRSKGYSQYGASMGRRSISLDKMMEAETDRLSLSRVRLSGDYDAGGAYWGAVDGSYLWCVYNGATGETHYKRFPSYLDRARVKAELIKLCPALRFAR
jgi:hypothetical protein